MSWPILIGAAIAVGAVCAAALALRAYARYRGERVVSCPETHRPVGVHLDAGHASISTLLGKPDFRLSDCTRWPERRNCGQECLSQIEASPEGCLVRNILGDWYSGKKCSLCGEPFGEIQWFERKPGLRDAEGGVKSWDTVKAVELEEALRTHTPVCFDCLVAEAFRLQFPDRVVDRERPSTPEAR